MKPPAKRGRSYTNANTNYLLDLIEAAEPCGADEWNSIASSYNSHFNGESRSGEDLKNKFKALKNVKKPTGAKSFPHLTRNQFQVSKSYPIFWQGDPTCPPEVKRAKRLQKAMESRMDVQTLGEDHDDVDEQEADPENAVQQRHENQWDEDIVQDDEREMNIREFLIG